MVGSVERVQGPFASPPPALPPLCSSLYQLINGLVDERTVTECPLCAEPQGYRGKRDRQSPCPQPSSPHCFGSSVCWSSQTAHSLDTSERYCPKCILGQAQSGVGITEFLGWRSESPGQTAIRLTP